MNSPINVLVVDDDFNIARMHSQYVASVKGYESLGISLNYEQALSHITEHQPDLLLLDVFMPDKSGIELLRVLRAKHLPCDIILITAAKELNVVEEGFRLGIFDYLIKPFDLDQLKTTLKKYQKYRSRLDSLSNINQEDVEDLKNLRAISTQVHPQKGIDVRTLNRIKEYLNATNDFKTLDEIVKGTGVSRSTARNYMSYLVQINQAEEVLQYGTIGRPQTLYRMKLKLNTE
jgi:response regulator of citrate/malate metabolism